MFLFIQPEGTWFHWIANSKMSIDLGTEQGDVTWKNPNQSRTNTSYKGVVWYHSVSELSSLSY
jgi:hypothetical protein